MLFVNFDLKHLPGKTSFLSIFKVYSMLVKVLNIVYGIVMDVHIFLNYVKVIIQLMEIVHVIIKNVVVLNTALLIVMVVNILNNKNKKKNYQIW